MFAGYLLVTHGYPTQAKTEKTRWLSVHLYFCETRIKYKFYLSIN